MKCEVGTCRCDAIFGESLCGDHLQRVLDARKEDERIENTPPIATKLVLDAANILGGKAIDYGKRSKNFHEAATIASIIRGKDFDGLDTAAIMIGVKLSRLGNLTSGKGKQPLFEKVEDTEMDLINYIALFEEVRQSMGADNE